jgi:hypothetical protein
MTYRIWLSTNYPRIEKYVKLIPKKHIEESELFGYWYPCVVCGEVTNLRGCRYEKEYHIKYYTKEKFFKEAPKNIAATTFYKH